MPNHALILEEQLRKVEVSLFTAKRVPLLVSIFLKPKAAAQLAVVANIKA